MHWLDRLTVEKETQNGGGEAFSGHRTEHFHLTHLLLSQVDGNSSAILFLQGKPRLIQGSYERQF